MKIDHSLKRRLINACKCAMPLLNAKRKYFKAFGHWPSLDKPVDLNEHILRMIYRGDLATYTRLADKLLVRDYVAEAGYASALIPVVCVTDSVAEIDRAALPQQFVIQPNNGSGAAFVVEDKDRADIDGIFAEVEDNLLYPFWCEAGEIQYRGIKPKVMVTQLLRNDSELSSTLIDYKFYCIRGEMQFCMVCIDRDIETHNRVNAFYDRNWQRCDEQWAAPGTTLLDRGIELPQPATWQRMLCACHDLVGQFPFARLDLYESGSKMYFGEITFTPNAFGRGIIQKSKFALLGSLCSER